MVLDFDQDLPITHKFLVLLVELVDIQIKELTSKMIELSYHALVFGSGVTDALSIFDPILILVKLNSILLTLHFKFFKNAT